MLIDKPGKITDGLYLLGQKQNIVYLVSGEQAMIIGGGMSWIAPSLEQQLNDLHLNTDKIRYLVIQHSHFDHVGAVPYLKRKFPQMKVLATEAARKTLSKEKVINSIAATNNVMLEKSVPVDQYKNLQLQIDKINVDETVTDSTVIGLGNGLDVHFIETPGHSPDTLSVYIPKLKAMFPSDCAPMPMGSPERLMSPSPQYDYALYKQSLRKLLSYDIDICGFEHDLALTGEDARYILINGQKLCDEYEQHVINQYNKLGDIEKVSRQEVLEMVKLGAYDFLNEDIMMLVSRLTVTNILKYAGIISG